MSGLQINLSPLKEPLGFIKVLEWVFSIFSFATCGGYSGETSLYLTCRNTSVLDNKTIIAKFAYPFRLYNNKFVMESGIDKICDHEWTDKFYLIGDYSSSAEFYVTIAVFAFLYCMGALVLYLGYKHLYQDKIPLFDFIITVIFAFLWLVSSSAWAKGLTDVKLVTNPQNIASNPEYCNQSSFYQCHSGSESHMGSLNVSVAFGFLNLILWVGNAWFVYKETNLHAPPPSSDPEQGPPSSSK